MLKKIFTISLGLILTSAASASLELRAKYLKTDCVISKDEVTRTMSFGTDKNVKFTEISKMSFQGLDIAARKAAVVATNAPAQNVHNKFEMTIDGKDYVLNQTESEEALALVQLMVKACQIN